MTLPSRRSPSFRHPSCRFLAGPVFPGLLAALILFALPPLSPAESPETLALEKKAEYWTAHGRDDLATQTYRQILFLDPDNRPALIGLASDALGRGKRPLAEGYVRKLRKMNPDDPVLPALQREAEMGPAWAREIAGARRDNALHLFLRALAHYQKAFGPFPPPPRYAAPYYDDLTHTVGGYRASLRQLRRLAARYPDSLHYRLALGEILSYDPKRRREALAILKPMAEGSSPLSETATAAWKRVLVWEGTLPRNIPEIRAYLALHRDRTLERQLLLAEKLALSSGPESRGAYRSLGQARFGQAAARFGVLVRRDPGNPAYWLGLSYACLGLKEFERSRKALDRARRLPLTEEQAGEVRDLARQISFWTFMERGREEEARGDTGTAGRDYERAGRILPGQPDLLIARAGLADRTGRDALAERLYRKAIAQRPLEESLRAGILALYVREGRNRQAFASLDALSPSLRSRLEEDPDFLVTEGEIYAHAGDPDKSKTSFGRALASRRKVPADREIAWGWTFLDAGDLRALGTLLGRLDRTPGLFGRERTGLRNLHRLRALREEQKLVARKRFDKALVLMKAHAARHPSERFYREQEAAILMAWGKKREAYRIVRKIGPGSTLSSHEAAAGLAMAAGHDLQARVWVADARSRWPERVRTAILEARLEQSENHLAKARKILERALARAPRNPRLLLAMADNDRALGRLDRARADVEKAVEAAGQPQGTAVSPERSLILAQARTALDAIGKDKKRRTEGRLELMAGETAFTQYTQYYYAQVGDILPLAGLGRYSIGNGKRAAPDLHLFLLGTAFTFEYHPSPSSASFLSQSYEGLTPAVGLKFPTSFGYWEGDAGVAVARHFQTLTPPGTVTGLFLQTDLLWNLLGGGLDLFANFTGYIDYVYFQARYLRPVRESDTRRFRLDMGPEFIAQGNATYDAFQGGLALRLWLAPLRSSLLLDGGILNSSAFPGVGGYEGVSWYFLY